MFVYVGFEGMGEGNRKKQASWVGRQEKWGKHVKYIRITQSSAHVIKGSLKHVFDGFFEGEKEGSRMDKNRSHGLMDRTGDEHLST